MSSAWFFIGALRRRFLRFVFVVVGWFSGKRHDFTVGIHELTKGIRSSPREESLEAFGERRNESIVIEGSEPNGHQFFYSDVRIEGDYASAFVALRFDNNETFVLEETRQKTRVERSTIRVGALTLECREPFRKWRIQLRGIMKSLDGKQEKFIKLNGWWGGTWIPSHSFADLDPAQNSCGFEGASMRQAIDIFRKASRNEDFVHFGEFRCKMDESEFHLRGARIRRYFDGDLPNRSDFFAVYFENGDRAFFHHNERFGPDYSLSGGHFFAADLSTHRLQKFDADVVFDEDSYDDIQYSAESLGSAIFAIEKSARVQFSFKRVDGSVVTVRRILLNHRAKNSCGYCVIVNEVNSSGKIPTGEDIGDSNQLAESNNAIERKITVALSERECEDANVSGGKGSNLAKLTRMQSKFAVPRGFVIAVAAFQDHLDANCALKTSVEQLEEKQTKDSLERLEQRVSAELERTSIGSVLREDIARQLKSIFNNHESIRFAVRSSAVGEDSSELSSAGQLESFLNVSGTDEMMESVIACWKSNFRREALSYRRHYGQILNPPMAVVVQEMIDEGVAGVLFTNHPVDGNPDLLVLNAIRGIGEDLVSGHVTPTEIVLTKKLEIVSMGDEETISGEQAKMIGAVGMELEERFGNPQDVEFVLKGEELFVVQTRDITNLDLETNWELLHEFDTPLLTDREILSTANVGEVLPNALSPLSVSAIARLYDISIRAAVGVMNGASRLPTHTTVMTAINRQRQFMNLTDMYMSRWNTIKKDAIFEINLAGKRIFTEEMFEIGKERYRGISDLSNLGQLLRGMRVILFDSYRRLNDAKTRIANSPLAQPQMTTVELLNLVETQRDILAETISDHAIESIFSSFTYVFVASLIRGSFEGDLNAETLSDIATVYSASKSTVISADVPTSLEKIANQIREEEISAEFNAIDDDREALEWLQARKGGRSSEMLAEFFANHGHRGLNELDAGGVSWKRNPAQLTQTLKAMLANAKDSKTEATEDVASVVDRLNCSVSGFKRTMLEFFIRQAHRGVEFREAAKNLIVKGTDNLRETILLVGEKLHEENRIPHPDLILSFTLREVREFTETRSARIVARAHKREKILALQDAEEYALMHLGHPQEKQERVELPKGARLEGTPVCQGVVRGKARVAKSLDEARDTQPGEILITRYTDVAWSPYFPLILGLVTEIGGLLSHGSVVAREYGLPSLIAVENATDFFRTGDDVILDSKSGFIARAAEKRE